MELEKSSDIFSLSVGDIVSKRNLFDLIKLSKVKNSIYWSGPEFSIGNTPQQGINWIGQIPKLQAVIIKTLPGMYKNDGWSDINKSFYHYSFKAYKGKIRYSEKANGALIMQPMYLYPILLFTEYKKNNWFFEGSFSISEIESKFVVLDRYKAAIAGIDVFNEEQKYQEGDRKYIAHFLIERNKDVVRKLKDTKVWLCDICEENFYLKYGVKYIEAHHKIPISTYSSKYSVNLSDFELLCPNCHKAIHIYMRKKSLEYNAIKEILINKKFLLN